MVGEGDLISQFSIPLHLWGVPVMAVFKPKDRENVLMLSAT
jgi:hypothetical protein